MGKFFRAALQVSLSVVYVNTNLIRCPSTIVFFPFVVFGTRAVPVAYLQQGFVGPKLG